MGSSALVPRVKRMSHSTDIFKFLAKMLLCLSPKKESEKRNSYPRIVSGKEFDAVNAHGTVAVHNWGA